MRVALIDADSVCWRAAAAAERDFGENCVDRARAGFDARIASILERLGARAARLALSDSADRLWRRGIWPGYKAARRGRRRPAALAAVRAHAEAAHGAALAPALEADDLVALWATGVSAAGVAAPSLQREVVIVSDDKDLRTVPGLHAGRDGRIFRVSRAGAERAHLAQTLTGDAADGYRGCPGVGAKTAAAFLDAPWMWIRTGRRAAGAARGGGWGKAAAPTVWDGVVSLFEKAGLEERDALREARLARILRAGDVDPATLAPRLWTPDRWRSPIS